MSRTQIEVKDDQERLFVEAALQARREMMAFAHHTIEEDAGFRRVESRAIERGNDLIRQLLQDIVSVEAQAEAQKKGATLR